MSLESQVSPPQCHIPSLFPPLIIYSRNNTHMGKCTLTTHTHTPPPTHPQIHAHTGATHSSRRHGQIVSDTLQPSREPPCTSNRGGQKRKPVSHVEALGQLYKTVIHTQRPTHKHKYNTKAGKDYTSTCCLAGCAVVVKILFTDQKHH